MKHQPTPDERRFRALANSSVERIVELAPDGRAVFVSDSHWTGGDEVLGSLASVCGEDQLAVARCFAAAFAGEAGRLSFRVVDSGGALRWVESTLTPFEAEGGQCHVLVVSRDVSEARRLEQRLRESRERFQLIAENAYDMIVELDDGMNVLYANDQLRNVLGFGGGSQRFDLDFVHPDERERIAEMFLRVYRGSDESATSTYRVRRADGSWCWIDGTIRGAPQADGSRRILIIARDVTARVEAEQCRRESEQRYRELVENAPVGTFVIQDEAIVYANPAAASLCGATSAAALCGAHMDDLFDQGAVRGVTAALSRVDVDARRRQGFDLHVTGLDGAERHLIGVGNLISYDGKPAFQAIVRDVTELEESRREQGRLALQLQEARKLESLGVLAGGIAHDFNNLLAVILSSVRFARADDVTDEERQEALADAVEATESASRLVKQLLAYAGRRSPEVRSLDLCEVAGSLSDLLATALPGGVELRLETAPEPLPVFADLVQLEQVLMNLVLNAADAVGAGPGTVTVRTHRRDLRPAELRSWLGGETLGGGPYALLEVEDTGGGMDEPTRARIFEPFFTTKEEGHGLGLSAVLGLVQGHRGAIDVESAPGVGTRFRIALPMERAAAAPERVRGGLVLWAEANGERRRAAASALHAAGHQVVEAGDVEQLLDLWALHGAELDAAVIDADGPSLDARRLVAALVAARPDLAMLALVEGDQVPPWIGRRPGMAILRRPFTERQLVDALAELLAKRETPV